MNESDSSHDRHEATSETLVSSSERYCPSCDESYPTTIERCPADGTALVELTEDVDTLIGMEIDGRFTIRRKLGKGGMGAAYAAVQHSIGREVAIKVIHPHLARDKMGAKRFLRETKLAAQLNHPNTVTVLDFGQTEAKPGAPRRLYMAMELVEGVTLAHEIRSGGAMSLERAMPIAIQLCDALAAAHRLEIVHRDLKPSNIMLEGGHGRGDHVKVLDFGLAKSLVGDDTTVTESNAIIGTPQYIAPELVVGDTADTRADLYSLGAVLYELVSGRPPFVGESVQACLFSQVHDAPPPLPASVPTALADVILQLLSKRPELRYQSAAEVREALDAVSRPGAVARTTAAEPVASEPATIEPVEPPRRPWPLIFGGIVALASLGVLAFIATRGDKDSAAPDDVVKTDKTDKTDNTDNMTDNMTAAAAITDAAPAAIPDAAPTSVAAPKTITVSLRSSPEGASARADGQRCTTPCEMSFSRGDRPISIRFTRSGYRSSTKRVIPKGDATLDVELTRRGARTSGKGDGTGKSDGSGKPPDDGFVEGYD